MLCAVYLKLFCSILFDNDGLACCTLGFWFVYMFKTIDLVLLYGLAVLSVYYISQLTAFTLFLVSYYVNVLFLMSSGLFHNDFYLRIFIELWKY
jgi:hypothetical protein